MHFLCYCGYRIQDSSDNLSYKANIIADQDWDDIWTWYEKLEKDGGMDREKKFAMFEDFLGDVTLRNIYQCPKCGRLYLEGNVLAGDKRLYAFAPEQEQEPNTHLLQSYLGNAWKGQLTAEWRENPPEWNPHKGSIYVDVNGDPGHYYSFEEYREFEDKYYRLFNELKDICLRGATLYVERQILHSWSLNDDEKENTEKGEY